MTFGRCYLNQQNSYAYKRMFQETFRIIGSLCQREVQWKHIHGTGFGALVLDMDSAQFKGNIFQIYSKYITNT